MFIDWTVWDTADMDEIIWRLNVVEFHIYLMKMFSLSACNTHGEYIISEHIDKQQSIQT